MDWISRLFSRAFGNRQIFEKISVVPAAIRVVLPRTPQLAANVGVPVAVHVADDRFVAAQPIVDDHALFEFGTFAVHVLPNKPPRLTRAALSGRWVVSAEPLFSGAERH